MAEKISIGSVCILSITLFLSISFIANRSIMFEGYKNIYFYYIAISIWIKSISIYCLPLWMWKKFFKIQSSLNCRDEKISHKNSLINNLIFFILHSSLWMQWTCETMPLQYGTIQTLRSRLRRCMCGMSTCNNRTTLPLLSRRLLSWSNEANCT